MAAHRSGYVSGLASLEGCIGYLLSYMNQVSRISGFVTGVCEIEDAKVGASKLQFCILFLYRLVCLFASYVRNMDSFASAFDTNFDCYLSIMFLK